MTITAPEPTIELLEPSEALAPTLPPVPPDLPSVRFGRIRRGAAAIAWASVGVAVLLAIWAWAGATVEGFPTPVDGLSQLRDLLADAFHNDGPNDKGIALLLQDSLGRVAQGFVLAVIVGVPLGLAMGSSRRVWQAFNPVIQFLRPVSPLAWYPIWLVILQDTDFAAKWVIFITAIWSIVLNTAAGAAGVPRAERDVARVFKFKRWTYVRQVLVPNSLPSIVTGMRLAMGVAWMVIVAAEMLSGGSGIGSYIWNDAYNGGSYPKLIAAVILIGAVGLVLDLLFLRLGRAVAIEQGDDH